MIIDDKTAVLYTATIKKEKGQRLDFDFKENEEAHLSSLVKVNLVGRIMFLVEGINILAENDELDAVEEIEIRILAGDGKLTVMRQGNGLSDDPPSDPASEKLLFLIDVLDRRLANFCEFFADYIV